MATSAHDGDLKLLAERLFSRLGCGTVVDRVTIQIGDWRPRLNRCHFNVAELLERAPEYVAVRGWVAADYEAAGFIRFFAHSVVRRPDGKLVDITPNPNGWQYPFIQHLEADGDFATLVEDRGVIHIDFELPR